MRTLGSNRAKLLLAVSAFATADVAMAQQLLPPAPPALAQGRTMEQWNAQTAAHNAAKAAHDAEAAAMKARFGDLAGYATPGTVAPGTNAGKFEAAILSAGATREAGEQIAQRLSRVLPTGAAALNGAARPVIVYSETNLPNFDAYDSFLVQSGYLVRRMEAAERAVEPAKAPPSPPDSLLGGSAAGAMTALSVVGNLLRSDYSAQLIELTKDDLLLTKAVGLALRNARPDAWVLVPSLYTETTLTEANPAVVRLAQLQQLRARLEPKASRNSKGEAGLAAKAFDDWFQKMSTSDDKGSTPLALVARQARVAELLRGGGYLLLLKVNESGGSTYTQKNFWTFLGTMPFSVSGGTVVSYTLFRGSDGALVDSHVVPISSGFARVHQVHRDARADGTSQRRR